ncbi:MAG: hypothetical protein IIZ13_14890 [Renibacterium sp.]|nr:hypothetical protein [Renibacterium sp.]
MKKLVGGALLLVLGASTLAGCTFPDSNSGAASSSSPSASDPATAAATYPAPTGALDAQLTITLLSSNAGMITTRHLACSGNSAVSPTDFDGGDQACRFVQGSTELLTEKPPTEDSKTCQETGDPKVADVFGQVNGIEIRQSFRRNTTCGADRWDQMIPLLGKSNDG